MGVMARRHGIARLGRASTLRQQGADRVANWDELHALMSVWSIEHDKQAIADLAQRAHAQAFRCVSRRRVCRPRSLRIAVSTGKL